MIRTVRRRAKTWWKSLWNCNEKNKWHANSNSNKARRRKGVCHSYLRGSVQTSKATRRKSGKSARAMIAPEKECRLSLCHLP